MILCLPAVPFGAFSQEPLNVVITLKAGDDHPTVGQVHQVRCKYLVLWCAQNLT